VKRTERCDGEYSNFILFMKITPTMGDVIEL
jgi:hypothetical protein